MVRASAVRGSGLSSVSLGEVDHGERAARVYVTYWCQNEHEVRPSFSADSDEFPQVWECPHCGLPAGQDPLNPPDAPKSEPFKTHLAYVKERRTESEGEALLEEALERLRGRRSL